MQFQMQLQGKNTWQEDILLLLTTVRIWNCPCTTKSSPVLCITLVPWASTTWDWLTTLMSNMMDGLVNICTVMSTLRVLVRRGANNVALFIMKTLQKLNLLRKDSVGGELNIIFDNCSGQNKNNTVLTLLAWLMAMGYFKEIHFIFLMVGHTKNEADSLFNLLEQEYWKQNLFTFDKLVRTLN